MVHHLPIYVGHPDASTDSGDDSDFDMSTVLKWKLIRMSSQLMEHLLLIVTMMISVLHLNDKYVY